MNNKENHSSFEAYLPKSVASVLSSIAAKPITFDVVDVEFDVDAPALIKYAQSLSDSFLYRSQNNSLAEMLTPGKIQSYLGILLALRVTSVNRSVAIDTRKYRDSCPFPAVPAFFSLYLENVGTVTDVELGLELVPVLSKQKFELHTGILDPEAFAKLSNLMKTFGKEGFEYVDSLPRDKRGSWELMAMTCVNDEVQRHDGKAHMTYALLASLCNQAHITSPLLPRVTYGPTSYLEGLVLEFGRFK